MKTPSKPKKTEGIDRINLVNEDEGDGDTEGDEDLDTEGEGDEEDEEEESSSLGLLRTGINKRGQVISKGFLPVLKHKYKPSVLHLLEMSVRALSLRESNRSERK
jgi:TATA-binding protein-associated factor Taf7